MICGHLLRAALAGSWVLAILTVANVASPEAIASGQIRFAAIGQDPNDVARFLDLGFPVAALLSWMGDSLAGPASGARLSSAGIRRGVADRFAGRFSCRRSSR